MNTSDINTQPAWISYDGIKKYFGVSKSTIYRIEKSESPFNITRIGIKGSRNPRKLFEFDSVAKYFS